MLPARDETRELASLLKAFEGAVMAVTLGDVGDDVFAVTPTDGDRVAMFEEWVSIHLLGGIWVAD